jgi:hypothetical protein
MALGESPVDVAKDMETFQMLKMYSALRDSAVELAQVGRHCV